MPLSLLNALSTQSFTKPPPRFTEASLIKELERLGIGRPSTYVAIMNKIQSRDYTVKEASALKPTELGKVICQMLEDNFPPIMDVTFTAQMEGDLDNVANGKIPWVKTIKDFWTPFEKKLDMVGKKSGRVKIETEKTGRDCPECKEGELVIRIGRFGKFISCSRFPDCKYTEKYVEKTGMKCPDCKEGDVIIKKTGRGKSFFGCSRYPDCKWASWRNPNQDKKQ